MIKEMGAVAMFGVNEDGLPNVPSELLEPNLISVFTSYIRELGAHEAIPDEDFYRAWGLRFEGISYLISEMRSTHAVLAWGKLTHSPKRAGGLCDWISGCADEKATDREKLWNAAREASEEGVR
jgi:hypothetical protein